MKSIKLSVIIRSHNEINSVREVVNRIRRQGVENYEIIGVDNMSVDGTYEYLKSVCSHVVRLEHFTHASSCNIGVKKCRGRYIFITNAHSLLLDDTGLRHSLFFLESNPAVAGCFGKCIPTPEIANRVENLIFKYDVFTQPNRFRVHNRYVPGAMQTTCALFRTDLIKQYPFQEYHPLGGEDGLWAHQITKMNHKIAFLPQMNVYHAHGGSNLSTIKRYVNFAKLSLGYNFY